MKKIKDYESVQAQTGEREKPSAGGYICVITKAEDVPDKEYLYIEFDIVEGDFSGYCSDYYGSFGKWATLGKTYRSYKEKALGMFKAFTDAIEKSPENRGFLWDFNEKKLVGQYFGGVLGEEEFEGNDGEIRIGLKLSRILPTNAIREGKFTIPRRKTLQKREDDGFSSISMADCPFN